MTAFQFHRAMRRLRRAPAFSLASVLLLGLAFGALACVSSVVYGLLYKPLPFPGADRLVTVESRILGIPFDVGLSTPLRDELARSAQSIDAIAAYRGEQMVLRDEAGRRSGTLLAARVEPQVLELLGARPALGRLLRAEDVASGAARSAVLSWQEWQQRFGGASDAIGRMLRLQDQDYRVVGVLPRGFVFPDAQTRIWLPLAFSAADHERSRAGSFEGTLAVARLRGGASLANAGDELGNIARSIPELDSAFGNSFRLQVNPLRSLWLGGRRQALLLMLLAVAMVWLVTAANVVNLFLARALEQRQQMALAGALGATTSQRAQAVGAEAALVCTAGVAVGAALLPAGLALLRHFDLLPAGAPQVIGIDPPILLLLAALALMLCGVLTLVGLSVQRGNLHAMIRQGGTRQTTGGAAQAARRTLVVAQVALTVALLFGIGVLLRSSQNLLAEDVGFQRDHLLYASLSDLVSADATPEERKARLTDLVDRTRAQPGVVAAGLGSMVPFGTSIATTTYTPSGLEDSKEQPIAYNQQVDAGYFAALGMPILRGRAFTPAEARADAPLAIVDTLFVQRHFGASDPLGQHFKIGVGPGVADREVTIIGVVPTLKQRALDETAERVSIYQPNEAPPWAALVVRTAVDPANLIAPIKTLGAQVAPKDAIGPIVSLEQRIDDSIADRTRLNSLLGLLGLTSLLLAAVGLFAVLAYTVRQRVPEFGVRMALGASAGNVLRLVLRQGFVLIGLGLALGVPLAWVFARTLSARLYGVGAFDLPTLSAVALTLASVGLAACAWPARRAAATDPVVALRNE